MRNWFRKMSIHIYLLNCMKTLSFIDFMIDCKQYCPNPYNWRSTPKNFNSSSIPCYDESDTFVFSINEIWFLVTTAICDFIKTLKPLLFQKRIVYSQNTRLYTHVHVLYTLFVSLSFQKHWKCIFWFFFHTFFWVNTVS